MGNSARQSKLLPNTDQSGKDERRGDSQVPALARRAPGLSMLVVPAGPGSLGGLFLGCYVVTEILTDLTECFRHVAEFGVLFPQNIRGSERPLTCFLGMSHFVSVTRAAISKMP